VRVGDQDGAKRGGGVCMESVEIKGVGMEPR
jgi:hypothetical protein